MKLRKKTKRKMTNLRVKNHEKPYPHFFWRFRNHWVVDADPKPGSRTSYRRLVANKMANRLAYLLQIPTFDDTPMTMTGNNGSGIVAGSHFG